MHHIWDDIKQELKGEIPGNSFTLWIQPISLLKVKEQTLVLGCPNKFSLNWVTENYKGLIEKKIGQTGSGKSVLGLSVLRLLPENARITGKVLFRSIDLLSCTERELREIRGKEIMMVFQNPLATLNPLLLIERQLCEIPMYHEGISLVEAKRRAEQMLELCGLKEPRKVMQSHPFEMSGGMLQRVAIAMGIICRPSMLIADEPFKGLDISLQKQISGILYKVCRELEITLLIITHNLKVAKSLCDFISVMYEGKIVETADTEDFFSSPRNPYSKRLMDTFNMFERWAKT